MDENVTSVGVFGIAGVLLKWWFVVLPLVGLSLFLAQTTTDSIQPEYTADVSMIVVGSSEVLAIDPETGDIEIEDVNPLIALGTTLNTVASILALGMLDDAVLTTLDDEGLSTAVEVTVADRSPILTFEVTDRSREVAGDTADRMIELVQGDLERRQDELGAPDANRLFVQPIKTTTLGGADFGGRSRVRIAFAAVGVGLSCTVAYLLEALVQGRRRRKAIRLAGSGEGRERDPTGPAWGLSAIGAAHRWRFEASRLAAAIYVLTGDRALAEGSATAVLASAGENPGLPKAESMVVTVYREALDRIESSIALPNATIDAALRLPQADDEQMWRYARTLSVPDRKIVALHLVAELPVGLTARIVGRDEDHVVSRLEALVERSTEPSDGQRRADADRPEAAAQSN